jgi:two-component system CheB/CheR fusion protein
MSAATTERADESDGTVLPSPQFIVGVGASAGGLEAVAALLASLRADSMGVVVVQHLSPAHQSSLPQILARSTSFTVTSAGNGMTVAPNHVYVIPPNAALSIAQGKLQLTEPQDYGKRGAIDSFFRSLAQDQRERAIGVVLSGTGSDGTLGLQAIKEAGGITFVQQPESARFDGMPRAAIDSGWADFCGSPSDIGHELMKVGQHPYLSKSRREPIVDDSALHDLVVALREAFSHDLTEYKPSTLERRTERRMALHKLVRIADYVKLVQSDPGELRALYRDLLIGVTNFFRDHDPFEALKSKVFPAIVERKRSGSSMRIWTPACSTGEEAYSMAIAAAEFCDAGQHDLRIQIFATDIDDEAIQRARRGVYSHNIALDVSPERLHRFFVRTEDQFQINRRIRDMVVFSTQDVTSDAPFSRLDLLSCRNLLIYLKPVMQKRVLRVFHYALQPQGFLLLGNSETVGDSADLFSVVDAKNKVYVCKHLAVPSQLELSSHRPRGEPERILPTVITSRPAVTLAALADRKVLDLYGPAGVVVNEGLEILHFRGRTSRYLEPAPGVASLNLLRLARPELQADLRRTTREAFAETRPISVASRVSNGDTRSEFKLEVLPIIDPETRARCLLVLFHEPYASEPLAPPAGGSDAATDHRVQDLELELLLTKEHLQSTIDELEGTNEALKSSNEELQSSNEELQSTNEEVETSKEEIQSTNEELTTVNEELQNRMVELQQTNDDLHNVLTGVENAVIIVSRELRIRRFTAAAERLLGIRPEDVGQSISLLERFVGGLRLDTITREVMETLRPSEEELQCADGRWYLLRVLPYKTLENSINGAVIVLSDIDVRKRSLRLGEDVAAYAAKFLEVVKQALAIVDSRLRIIWVNEHFYRLFGVVSEETINGTFLSVVGGQWDVSVLSAMMVNTAATGASFHDAVVRHRSPDGEERELSIGGSRIPRQRDDGQLILLSFEVR